MGADMAVPFGGGGVWIHCIVSTKLVSGVMIDISVNVEFDA